MTTAIVFLSVLLFIQLIIARYACLIINRNGLLLYKIKDKQELIENQIDFTNNANIIIIWKLRHDITQWQQACVKDENYEMADQAQVAIDVIDAINAQYHNKNNKHNNDN